MAHRALTSPRFMMLVASSALWAQAGYSSEISAKSGAAAPIHSGETLAKPAPAPADAPASNVHTGIAGSFLSGRFARENQDLEAAARYLNEALAKDPGNLALAHEALRQNLLAGDTVSAIALAKKLSSAGENDPLIASLLMLDDVNNGNYAKAKEEVNHAPGNGLYGLIKPVILQWLAIGAGEQKGPVSLQAAIDKAGFFAPFLTYHSALMNDVIGQRAAAQENYLKAAADPAAAPYRVVQAFANFYMREGKWDEAQRVYDSYAKANPSSSLIPEKLTSGKAPAPMVADAKAGLAEVFFTTASLLFSNDSAPDTFLYLRIALELRPDLAPGQLMLANLYEQMQAYDRAIQAYDAISPDTVFYRRAQVRKALNYEALKQPDKAIELLDTVSKRYPDDTTALITKGDLLRDAENYPEAAKAYSAAITRSEPLKALDWPLLYARGISYERSGDWPSAEADFNRALVLSPNQPDVLNYLAYSWLTMNKNLAQARGYLDIAAAARPDDGNIADSVGWAHYLSGDFTYAVTKLEHAVEVIPDNPAINEHLGDAYWRVGRQTEARYQWERALTYKPDKESEQAIREKLQNGMTAFVSPADDKSGPAAKADSSATQVQ